MIPHVAVNGCGLPPTVRLVCLRKMFHVGSCRIMTYVHSACMHAYIYFWEKKKLLVLSLSFDLIDHIAFSKVMTTFIKKRKISDVIKDRIVCIFPTDEKNQRLDFEWTNNHTCCCAVYPSSSFCGVFNIFTTRCLYKVDPSK